MERTILVRTDRNIWDHLGRWSTLTGLVISVGQTEMSIFHLTQSWSPELLLCILLIRTITKHAVAWVGSVQPQCTVPFNMWNFRDFKPKWKAPLD